MLCLCSVGAGMELSAFLGKKVIIYAPLKYGHSLFLFYLFYFPVLWFNRVQHVRELFEDQLRFRRPLVSCF